MQGELERAQKSLTQGAGNEWEVAKLGHEVAAAKAAVAGAQARLALMKAGAWEPDKAIARQQIEQVKADLRAIAIRIDRMIVRAPVQQGVSEWTVLKRNIEPGEYAMVSAGGGG